MLTDRLADDRDVSVADRLLTVEEVADWRRVHENTVRRWYREGKLRIERQGDRSIRIRESALQEFIHDE